MKKYKSKMDNGLSGKKREQNIKTSNINTKI